MSLGYAGRGPSLVEFLGSEKLSAEPSLRSQLIDHVLRAGCLDPPDWIIVLDALKSQTSCVDVICSVVEGLRCKDPTSAEPDALTDWARRCSGIAAIDAPLPLRLRLHALTSSTTLPQHLVCEAQVSLLKGDPLPEEAVALLDANKLWDEAVKSSSFFAAARAVRHISDKAALRSEEGVESFLRRGLVHPKRAVRRACIEVVEALWSVDEAVLLSLLSEQQPLHLLEAVPTVPPAAFAETAAELALRHGDHRVHLWVLRSLTALPKAALFNLFAAAALRHASEEHPPTWISLWEDLVSDSLTGPTGDFSDLACLLSMPFPVGTLQRILSSWSMTLPQEQNGVQSATLNDEPNNSNTSSNNNNSNSSNNKTREGAPPSLPDWSIDPAALRMLRRHDPSIAKQVAELLLSRRNFDLRDLGNSRSNIINNIISSSSESKGGEGSAKDDNNSNSNNNNNNNNNNDSEEADSRRSLMVEVLLCQPKEHLTEIVCLQALEYCSRRQLELVCEWRPVSVATCLARKNQCTTSQSPEHPSRAMHDGHAELALWALGALPNARAERIDAAKPGFLVSLGEGPPFAHTTFAACLKACHDDPSLVSSYPKLDKDYATIRPTLLSLGPDAAEHVTVEDVEVFLNWAPLLSSSSPSSSSFSRPAAPAAAAAAGAGATAGAAASSPPSSASARAIATKPSSSSSSSVSPSLRLKRLGWLDRSTALLSELFGDGEREQAAKVKSTMQEVSVKWALATKGKDVPLVIAALCALVVCGGGHAYLEALWNVVRSWEVARLAVDLLDIEQVPDKLLERILSSSTLSAALAAKCIQGAGEDKTHLLVTLAIKAKAASGTTTAASSSSSFGEGAPHPVCQLRRALLDRSPTKRAELVRRLLHEEYPKLPPEGSPKGEAIQQHLRLWVLVGSALELEPGLAEEVAETTETALQNAVQLPTRVLLQNVWARAARASSPVLDKLTKRLQDHSTSDSFAPRLLSLAAQLVLHPSHGNLSAPTEPAETRKTVNIDYLDRHEGFGPLLAAVVGWSASYVQTPRLLASITLFHAMERGLIETPGWYLLSLRESVFKGAAFKKLREAFDLERLVSDCWATLQPARARPSDVALSLALKRVSDSFWSSSQANAEPGPNNNEDGDGSAVAAYQRRPDVEYSRSSVPTTPPPPEVIIVGSLLDNLPNIAGLVRTAESLLGSRAEVALHTTNVLTDPAFLKMSVAAERALSIVPVPKGPRLLTFLREKRCEGFLVAALEQTSDSTPMKSAVLPRRMVLIVGNEQQGVPSWLTQSGLIDLFFELPLLGRTGSLNAHIATAMALWHYRLTH